MEKKKKGGGLVGKLKNEKNVLRPLSKTKTPKKKGPLVKRSTLSADCMSAVPDSQDVSDRPTAIDRVATGKLKKGKKKKKRKASSEVSPADKAPPKEAQLEMQQWYHGAVHQGEVVERLRKEGDFLVRLVMKDNREANLVLSVQTKDKTAIHLTIIRDAYGFHLDGEEDTFDCAYGLVKYYVREQESVTKAGTVIIKKAVARPEYYIRETAIKEKTAMEPGRFGDVFKVDVKMEGQKAKEAMFKKAKNHSTEEERMSFILEAKFLHDLDHSHVIKLVGLSVDNHPIGVVVELMEDGNLYKYLQARRGSISPAAKLKMACDISSALEHLEKKHVIHRDIRTTNVMVGKAPAHVLKLAEFGMARRGPVYEEKGENKVVAMRWSAPESMTDGVYTARTDTFSFGVFVWELFHDADQPWSGLQDHDVKTRVVANQRLGWRPEAPARIQEMAATWFSPMPSTRPGAAHLHTNLTTATKEFYQANHIYGEI